MKSNELLRMLKRAGWYVDRQKGSHLIMKHPGRGEEFISVPNHGSAEVGKGLLRNIQKRAGI
jgi:predicted RNA binding protein YcfA (HicA-like mRNA interferase family)